MQKPPIRTESNIKMKVAIFPLMPLVDSIYDDMWQNTISKDLLALLAGQPEMNLTAWESAVLTTETPIDEAADDLGVHYVISGTIDQIPDSLFIQIHLNEKNLQRPSQSKAYRVAKTIRGIKSLEAQIIQDLSTKLNIDTAYIKKPIDGITDIGTYLTRSIARENIDINEMSSLNHAIKQLENIAGPTHRSATTYAMMANAYIKQFALGSYHQITLPKVAECAEIALSIDSTSCEALIALLQYNQLENQKDVKAILQKAQIYCPAISKFQELVNRHTDYNETWIKGIEKAYQANPLSPDIAIQYHDYHQFETKDMDKAKATLDRIIKYHPNHTRAHIEMADLLENSSDGGLDQAFIYIYDIIQEIPNNEELSNHLLRLAAQLDIKPYVYQFAKEIKLKHPNSPAIKRTIYDAFLMIDDQDAAINLCREKTPSTIQSNIPKGFNAKQMAPVTAQNPHQFKVSKYHQLNSKKEVVNAQVLKHIKSGQLKKAKAVIEKTYDYVPIDSLIGQPIFWIHGKTYLSLCAALGDTLNWAQRLGRHNPTYKKNDHRSLIIYGEYDTAIEKLKDNYFTEGYKDQLTYLTRVDVDYHLLNNNESYKAAKKLLYEDLYQMRDKAISHLKSREEWPSHWDKKL